MYVCVCVCSRTRREKIEARILRVRRIIHKARNYYYRRWEMRERRRRVLPLLLLLLLLSGYARTGYGHSRGVAAAAAEDARVVPPPQQRFVELFDDDSAWFRRSCSIYDTINHCSEVQNCVTDAPRVHVIIIYRLVS